MKNLLVIAYYFPPSGGPGVQRVLKHIKYLPEFGWNPIVLTVSNGTFPARDESLFAEIPEGTIVERTTIYEPYTIYRKLTGKKPGTAIDVNNIKKEGQKLAWRDRISEFIRATFFIPDARIGWILTANKAAEELVRKYDIQAVYSSSPPYTCSLIGKHVQKKCKLPWVAGFRDPWTKFLTTPKRWFLPGMIDRYLEHSVFKNANAVECAWEGIIKDALGKYPTLESGKFFHVPNGFDSSDFPNEKYTPNEKFTITYTGSMYGRRNPESFFKAIQLLIDRKFIDKDKIKLRFVGRFGNEVHEMFDNAEFKSSIEIIGYVTHHESIAFLLKSEALLLVVDEAKESEEIVPGKVYEYVGVKRPIIAIAPQNSAIAELIKETNSGKIAHQSEVELIANNVLEFYNDWNAGTNNYQPNIKSINNYERRNASKQLAQLLNNFGK